VQISLKIQFFGPKLDSLLKKEAIIGCAAAHPAHPLPPVLLEILELMSSSFY